MTVQLEDVLRDPARLDTFIPSWPGDRTRTVALRRDLFARWKDLHRSLGADRELDRVTLELMAVFWARSVLSLAYSQQLADGFDAAGMQIDPGPRFPVLNALLTGSPLPEEGYFTLLRSGPPAYPLWRWPMRMARQASRRSPISVRPKAIPDNADVTTLAVGGLIDLHVRKRNVTAALRDSTDWFAPVAGEPVPTHLLLVDQVLECAVQAIEAYGLVPRAAVTDALRRSFVSSAGYVEAHIRRLRRIKSMPRELWIGSSSNFWPRLLGHEVMRRGGRTVSHDHGSGSSRVREGTPPLALKGFCTDFVTFTKDGVPDLQAQFRDVGFDTSPVPQVSAIGAVAVSGEHPRPVVASADPGPKTVMVLPLPLFGEMINLAPFPDDIACQDFNFRLCDALMRDGWRVLLKPHPAFDNTTLNVLADFGAEVLHDRFEDVVHRADAVVFTYPLTSTFSWSMVNCLPMVLIDFGLAKWTDSGKAGLKDSVAIVNGTSGVGGRLHADFPAILDALARVSNKHAQANNGQNFATAVAAPENKRAYGS